MLATIFGLVIVFGCAQQARAETQLAYYLSAKTTPIIGEPSPDGGIPTGEGWRNDTYVTPIGVKVPITRRLLPEITLAMDAIERVTLYSSPLGKALVPSSTTVYARLTVAPEIRAKLDSIAQRNQGYSLLIESGNHFIDHAPAFASSDNTIPGGVFSSEKAARNFYDDIRDRLVVRLSSPDEEHQWRSYLESFAVAMQWRLKCDREFQADLERDGYDRSRLAEMMQAFDHEHPQLSCSDKPPELPTAP